jgi:hypothetical protein
MAFNFYALLVVFMVSANSDHAFDISSRTSQECQLLNERYNFEYLYAASGLSLFSRRVYTWSSLSKNVFRTSEHSLTFSASDPQGVWLLEKIHQVNFSSPHQLFFIKNFKYNEYLYATRMIASFLSPRRDVFTRTATNSADLDDSYKWSIKQLDAEGGKYEIWNVKYNEPLYAANSFFKEDSMRRKAYTWYKNPDSRQFNWFIKCRTTIVY